MHFSPTIKTYTFLTDKGFSPFPLEELSAKSVNFILDGSLKKSSKKYNKRKKKNILGVHERGIIFKCWTDWGESDVEIKDSVRGKNVYVVQSSGRDTNNHLMGLLLFIQVY